MARGGTRERVSRFDMTEITHRQLGPTGTTMFVQARAVAAGRGDGSKTERSSQRPCSHHCLTMNGTAVIKPVFASNDEAEFNGERPSPTEPRPDYTVCPDRSGRDG